MSAIEFSKKLEPKGEYDVIVCGGGVAGVSAALSAKERGKSTLLIEKSILLGGLATLGLINLFVPMCNGRGKQITPWHFPQTDCPQQVSHSSSA